MPAFHVLFWNQVIQTNQFVFSALRPLTPRLSGGRILFVLRCTHFGFLYYQYPCQVSQDLAEIKVVAAFVIKREAFTQRVFHEKELPLQTGRTL